MDKYFSLLFDRPTEPLFIPKGEEKVLFEVPTKDLPEKYKNVATNIQHRVGGQANKTVKVLEISLPSLGSIASFPRDTPFSVFNSYHMEVAKKLLNIFMRLDNKEHLLYAAASYRDRVNPQLFTYALSTALKHRPDTKNVETPLLAEIYPDKFFDSSVFNKAKEQANILEPGLRVPIEIPVDWTATDKDPEHRVAYFREDVGINLHHWNWHIVYPYDGPRDIVAKDRRGELFYHMHHQAIARFNIERLCNNLARTQPLNDLRKPLPQGYFPKMDQAVAGRAWPARPANMVLSNLDRPADRTKITFEDIDRWLKNIRDAIRSKSVRTTDGRVVALDVRTGIDILGNMIEASPVLSPNPTLYGDIHNQGHNMIAYIHDPDHRFLENFAVMGDNTTAMRDPIFYRWHTFIDNLFHEYKDSLPPYNQNELSFAGVSVTKVAITSPKSNPNTMNTHWTKSEVDLSRGLDFTPRGAVLTRVQHLNHDEFTYTITANNANNGPVTGTVRIFMAPRLDENQRPLSFNEQRMLMIEMDKFTTTLKRGQNTITRRSIESDITIPFESTFRDLRDRPNDGGARVLGEYSYCGCGWPQHMLVPKGTEQGYPMDLFVMISDYRVDRVNQDDATGCRTGISFCGLRDRLYPDARAMGYPFDRVPGASSMAQFRTPNMIVQPITVRFTNSVKQRQ